MYHNIILVRGYWFHIVAFQQWDASIESQTHPMESPDNINNFMLSGSWSLRIEAAPSTSCITDDIGSLEVRHQKEIAYRDVRKVWLIRTGKKFLSPEYSCSLTLHSCNNLKQPHNEVSQELEDFNCGRYWAAHNIHVGLELSPNSTSSRLISMTWSDEQNK